MNKINNGVNMKVSAEKPATTHTHNRCASYKKTSNEQNIKIDLPNIHNDPKLFLC